MKTSGNTVLITGGGSGIGAALAQRFHDLGNTVIVAGRRVEALDRVTAGRPGMHAMPLDIAEAGDIAAFAERIIAEHPTLNVVINNAGIMRLEALDRARDLSDAEATITTNLLGPIRLTDALVAHLVTRPDAALINVSSGLAFVPLTTTPTYSATKAAIHSYTVSLREVLKGKVEVIELVPPAVQTDLTPGQATRARATCRWPTSSTRSWSCSSSSPRRARSWCSASPSSATPRPNTASTRPSRP
jgi:uncharacterized oxidoreductase